MNHGSLSRIEAQAAISSCRRRKICLGDSQAVSSAKRRRLLRSSSTRGNRSARERKIRRRKRGKFRHPRPQIPKTRPAEDKRTDGSSNGRVLAKEARLRARARERERERTRETSLSRQSRRVRVAENGAVIHLFLRHAHVTPSWPEVLRSATASAAGDRSESPSRTTPGDPLWLSRRLDFVRERIRRSCGRNRSARSRNREIADRLERTSPPPGSRSLAARLSKKYKKVPFRHGNQLSSCAER